MKKDSKQTVVITGGGRGLGSAITRTFAAAGYQVLIGSRTDSGLAGQLGQDVFFTKCDVTRSSDLRALMREALDRTGRLDVLINNAGCSDWRSLEAVDENFWQRMIDLNLKSVLFASQAAAAHMKQNGCIINISSLAGKRGSANNSVYCAAKFGVNGLTQALAKELGARGIRVNAVCPVYVQTDGLMEALASDGAPSAGKDVQTYLDEFARTQAALKRLPVGEEVANVCLFLVSGAASAVTGQCLNIDCGVMPQ